MVKEKSPEQLKDEVKRLSERVRELESLVKIGQKEDLRLANEVFENASAGIVITDQSGVIQRVNQAFTGITGFSPEEVVGRDYGALFPDLESDRAPADINGRQPESKRWTKRKNGEPFLEISTTTAIRDDKGQTVQLVKSFQDITAEERLKEEGQRIKEQTEMARLMTEIITFLPDPTMVIDKEGRVIAWNKAMEGLTRITAEQMLG
jgi:PAS domain S-box-containing protein